MLRAEVPLDPSLSPFGAAADPSLRCRPVASAQLWTISAHRNVTVHGIHRRGKSCPINASIESGDKALDAEHCHVGLLETGRGTAVGWLVTEITLRQLHENEH